MENFINKIISKLPKKIQNLWYSHESVWMYIIVGGLTTVVSFIGQIVPSAIFNSLDIHAGINTFLSTTISWILSVTFAFFTNKFYVFKSKTLEKSKFWREFFMFYGARLVTYFLELGIMEVGNMFFARDPKNGQITQWKQIIVKIAAQVIILTVNYIFSKYVVFKNKKSEKTANET